MGPLRPRLALHVRPTPIPALRPARRCRPTPLNPAAPVCRRCALKMLTSILLLGFATERAKSAAAADSSPRMGSYNGPADFLMGVDRYTLVGKRIA